LDREVHTPELLATAEQQLQDTAAVSGCLLVPDCDGRVLRRFGGHYGGAQQLVRRQQLRQPTGGRLRGGAHQGHPHEAGGLGPDVSQVPSVVR